MDRVYLKEGREREGIKKRGARCKTEERGGVPSKTAISSPPRFRTEEKGIGGDWSGQRRQLLALPGTAAARRWGKMKRGPRGSQPRARLRLRWLVEAAPREGRWPVCLGGGAQGRRRWKAREREWGCYGGARRGRER
jgi:hypothetical protein